MQRRWDGIEEMLAVEANGSFAGAAQALGVSTSHVSRAIARLEERLDAQIFSRTTRKVSLTDTGRMLVEQFRRIAAECDEALTLARGSDAPQGELRITCSTALGERFVAPVMRRFVEANPRLSVTLDLTNRIVDLVAEGYDLAIRTGQLRDSRLMRTRVAARRLILCASPGYLERRGTPAATSDLDKHECIGGTASHWSFSRDGMALRHKPEGRWRCNSGAAVTEAALAGMGLCQLPEFYVRNHIAAGRLVPVLEAFWPVEELIWAVYPQSRHQPPKLRDAIRLLKAELPASLATD